MSELIIRKAEEHDILEIARLETICFPEDPWSEESIRHEILENPAALYIVAEVTEVADVTGDAGNTGKQTGDASAELQPVIAGYMGVWKVVDEGHIMNVAVAPEFRRMHVGEAIIQTMLDVTAQNGVNTWTLEVRVDNDPAINLYRKFGFKEAGVRKGYYEYDHTDALIMWR